MYWTALTDTLGHGSHKVLTVDCGKTCHKLKQPHCAQGTFKNDCYHGKGTLWHQGSLYVDTDFKDGIVQPLPVQLVAEYARGTGKKADCAPEVPLCAPCTSLPITVKVLSRPAERADGSAASVHAQTSTKKPLSPRDRAKAPAAQAAAQGTVCTHEQTRPVRVYLHMGWPAGDGKLPADSRVTAACFRVPAPDVQPNSLHELFGSMAKDCGFAETDAAWYSEDTGQMQPLEDNEDADRVQQANLVVLQARQGVVELVDFEISVKNGAGTCLLAPAAHTLVFESNGVEPAHVPIMLVAGKQGK